MNAKRCICSTSINIIISTNLNKIWLMRTLTEITKANSAWSRTYWIANSLVGVRIRALTAGLLFRHDKSLSRVGKAKAAVWIWLKKYSHQFYRQPSDLFASYTLPFQNMFLCKNWYYKTKESEANNEIEGVQHSIFSVSEWI